MSLKKLTPEMNVDSNIQKIAMVVNQSAVDMYQFVEKAMGEEKKKTHQLPSSKILGIEEPLFYAHQALNKGDQTKKISLLGVYLYTEEDIKKVIYLYEAIGESLHKSPSDFNIKPFYLSHLMARLSLFVTKMSLDVLDEYVELQKLQQTSSS